MHMPLHCAADRLCYTADPEAEGARYLPLDRIPVRALPRGYGPKLGVTLIEDRQVGRVWSAQRQMLHCRLRMLLWQCMPPTNGHPPCSL